MNHLAPPKKKHHLLVSFVKYFVRNAEHTGMRKHICMLIILKNDILLLKKLDL